MKKVELLLPAGNMDCLRAAANNGADAVYLGLDRFNARKSAENFNENNIFGVVQYCHKRNVKVYVTLNILVKNKEIEEYFYAANVAYSAGVDAIIIQDFCMIPLLKKNFPKLKIHLSTQANTHNSYSVPDGVDRVVLARELPFEDIKKISSKFETEIFVHGALCFSYSGMCLFSSIAGRRSGNRGLCAQPCRMMYNNKYLLSTMDLCLLEKIPELIEAGVSSLKVEGRMRNPLYVATVAKIYKKYINAHYNKKFRIEEKDILELKIAYNREFTLGFGFVESITDSRKPMKRGVFMGVFEKGKLELKEPLRIGDGIGIWTKNKVIGYTVNHIKKEGNRITEAFRGDIIQIDTKGAGDKDAVYKTSSVDSKYNLGEEVKRIEPKIKPFAFSFPKIKSYSNEDGFEIFAKVYSKKEAIKADNAGANIIYYDVLNEDCAEVKKLMKNARFFLSTPRIIIDSQMKDIAEKIDKINPEGVLVSNRGLLGLVKKYIIHLDYSFNCFNDIDMDYYSNFTPIISPELNFYETRAFKNKNFIVMIHGDIVLMNSRQKLKAPELIDKDERHFRVRRNDNITQILNSSQLGLFNMAKRYMGMGVRYFYIDLEKDSGKYIRIYKEIFTSDDFYDRKLKKGYTTGHFDRGV